MTRFEEFMAGLSFLFVGVGGGLLATDVPRYVGDYNRLNKYTFILAVGYTLFGLVKLKLWSRSK